MLVFVFLGACEAPPASSACVPTGVAPEPAPEALHPFRRTVWDPQRSVVAGGHLLITQLNDIRISYAAVIDGQGRHVWWHPARGPQFKQMRARLGRDRSSVLIGDRRSDNEIDDARITRVDIGSGEILSTTVAFDHHHDFVEMPDGRIAYLSRDRVPDRWLGTDEPLAADVIRIAPEGSTDPSEHEVLFHTLDDLEPAWTCSHVQGPFLPDTLDWTHANSLHLDETTGDWTVMVRHFDALLRLDPSGAVRWWLGGPAATLDPLDGAAAPRHGHMSDAWPDGVLVFDNGNHIEDAVTRVVAYQIDTDDGTYRETWSLPHPEGRYQASRGDAWRLPGGHVLVVWSEGGRISEFTPEGELVWDVDTDQKVARVQFLSDWPAGASDPGAPRAPCPDRATGRWTDRNAPTP